MEAGGVMPKRKKAKEPEVGEFGLPTERGWVDVAVVGRSLMWYPADPEVEKEVIRAVIETVCRPARGWGVGVMVFRSREEAKEVFDRFEKNRAAGKSGG